MIFGPLDGRDVEHNGDGYAEISKIFAMQDTFIFGIVSFDTVQSRGLNSHPK